MKSLHRILLPAALAVLLCPILAQPGMAQSTRIPNIGEVEVVVRDIGTKRDVATVRDGETLSVPEGMRVRLIMTAKPTGSARGPYYPETEFSDLSQGGVRIVRSNEENSTADLQVVGSRNRDRVETIRYQINESWVPANLRSGSFQIVVGPPDSEVEVVQGWSTERARELTRVLYRGILMREPDAGANGTVSAIQRGGYDALVRAAMGIADSDESRIRVYEQRQGVCNEQRLLAMYKNFLGISSDQINRRQWEADLRRMREGEIDQVVESLLQSDRFRSRYNVTVASR